ncbi:hypothetical protein [Alteromonas sp. BMJM2]|uniref:hypothetical protein n=1 Tax=Alteromonas sp. BMJM2 TaxID=2954241 RepID=UPI0022B5951A|nr:hypothetical protein [Alteromonas sp. BMJM2]
MIEVYGDMDFSIDDANGDDDIVYWFEDIACLCTRNSDGSFFVLNGCWEFKIIDGNCVINEPMLIGKGDHILRKINKPKAMKRKQFDKMMPNFGY